MSPEDCTDKIKTIIKDARSSLRGPQGRCTRTRLRMTHKPTARRPKVHERDACDEDRARAAHDASWKIVEWMVKLTPNAINWCLFRHDGKTPYARLKGKNCSKDVVEIGEKVLPDISRGRT